MADISLNQCTGVILAGGRSSRMGGGDKFLLDIDGTTMLQMVIDQLSPSLPHLLISANGDLARLESYNLPVVADEIEGFAGPLAGIHAAMRWVEDNQPDCTHCLTTAADTPFFPKDYPAKMLAKLNASGPDHIIMAKSNGCHQPGFALWPISCRQALETALKDGLRKIRAFTDNQPNAVVEFENLTIKGEEIDPFFNVNEAADLELCRQLKAGSS